MEASVLAHIWYVILAVVFLVYIILDGFDLGVGILALFTRDEGFLDASMNAIMGVWHAHQTWLVIFGAILFGAFPAAYGLLMTALYIPVGLLLLGVILRGVGLEYYHYAGGSLRYRHAFTVGSVLTAAAQGLGVGVLLTGLPLDLRGFSGTAWSWLSPLSILLALGLPCWYALLGAAGMMNRTEGPLRGFCVRAANVSVWASLASGVVVILCGAAFRPFWARGWFAWPDGLFTLLPVLIGALMFAPMIRGMKNGGDRPLLPYAVLAVSLIFLGVVTGMHPFLVWPAIAAPAAAAPAATLKFMLVGVGIALPVIVAYNLFMYHVFKGATGDNGYGI